MKIFLLQACQPLDDQLKIQVTCSGAKKDMNITEIEENVAKDYPDLSDRRLAIPDCVFFDDEKTYLMELLKKEFERTFPVKLLKTNFDEKTKNQDEKIEKEVLQDLKDSSEVSVFM